MPGLLQTFRSSSMGTSFTRLVGTVFQSLARLFRRPAYRSAHRSAVPSGRTARCTEEDVAYTRPVHITRIKQGWEVSWNSWPCSALSVDLHDSTKRVAVANRMLIDRGHTRRAVFEAPVDPVVLIRKAQNLPLEKRVHCACVKRFAIRGEVFERIEDRQLVATKCG